MVKYNSGWTVTLGLKKGKRMNRIATLLILAICAFGMLCVGNADAQVLKLVSTMDGDQADAGAGTGSPATGTATMTYDTNTGEFSWDISWSGLLGDETAMHFHGPADFGQNAGVQVDIGAISGLTSPSIGSTNIGAGQATQ